MKYMTLYKYQRTLLGLSQQEIANFCGIHREEYSKYENGIHTPSLEKQYKIAIALGLDKLADSAKTCMMANKILYTENDIK